MIYSTTTKKLIDKEVFVGPTFGAHLLGRYSLNCAWWHIGALCLSILSAICFQTCLFSTLSPICSTQHVAKKKLAWLAPKNQIQRVLLHVTYISFLEQKLLGDDTVGRRNPAQPGMYKHCKTWDSPHVNWLARALPSTVSPFMSKKNL